MKKLSYLGLGASLGALTLSHPAMAQSTADTQVSDSQAMVPAEIVVSARRRDESIQDVPSVVNAVTSEAISKLNIRNFTEVATVVPGLELTNNVNGIGGNAKLRGVNFDVNASGNNPTVEFYLNDAPIAAGVVLQQIYDVEQIEVLRGPQGTLRGRASPSGSITVTTRKPNLNEVGGYIEGTGTDLGAINFQGGINVPIIPGVAAVRVAGVHEENDFDRVRPINRSFGGRDPFSRTSSGRISALVEPTDWLRLEGGYQTLDRTLRSYTQAESFSFANPQAPLSAIPIRAKDRRSVLTNPRQIEQKFDVYNWRAEGSFVGQRLIYQGQHYTQDLHSVESQDTASLFPGVPIDQTTATFSKSTSHEVRLQNEERVLGSFDYVIGFFDNKNKIETSLNSPTIVRLPIAFGGGIAQIVQTQISVPVKTHEQSYFGNLTLHVGSALELAGGLRYITYKDETNLIVGGFPLSDVKQDRNKFIYNGSIKYNINPDFLIYASTGSSWRPGITAVGNFNLARSDLEDSFVTLAPETSKSYEIGFKSSLFERRLRTNVSAFHQTFKNYPYRSPGGVFYVNTVALRDNVGNVTGLAPQVAIFNFVAAVPVEVNGIEGELNYSFSDRFSAGIVASYSLGKIKGGTIPCNDLNGDGVPDATVGAPTLAQLQAAVGANNVSACNVSQRSSFQAPFSASIQSEYNVPISGKMNGYVRGLYSLYGNSQTDPANAFDDLGSYGLLNLYAGLRDPDGAWELSLFAKNVLDTTKALSRSAPLFTAYQQLPGAIVNGVPTITGAPTGESTTIPYTSISSTVPREFGVNFKFRFGSR